MKTSKGIWVDPKERLPEKRHYNKYNNVTSMFVHSDGFVDIHNTPPECVPHATMWFDWTVEVVPISELEDDAILIEVTKVINQRKFEKDRQEFLLFLEKTAEEVRAWPEWKRNVI